jgi:hypothetical protein
MKQKQLSELKPGDKFWLGTAKCMVLQDLDFSVQTDKGVWAAVLDGGMYYEAGQTWYMLPELQVEVENV